jgi:hypothetical protein
MGLRILEDEQYDDCLVDENDETLTEWEVVQELPTGRGDAHAINRTPNGE